MKIDLSQIIEKFNQLDIKIRYAIFVGLLAAVLVLDFFTVISFQSGALGKVDASNQTIKQDIDRLKADLQRVNQMKMQLQASRTELEALNIKIRPIGEISSILEDVSRIAGQEGVKIEQVTPQGEPQPLLASGQVKYSSLPVVIQATSGYHVLGHFINKLESANLFFILSNLTIEDRGGDVNHHSINATMKFVLSDKNTGAQK